MSVVYEGTQDIPDGIAFRTLLVMVVATAEEDVGLATALIGQEIEVDPARAHEILDMLQQSQTSMNKQRKHDVARHACSPGEPYQILDELYDVVEQVTLRFYRAFVDTLEYEEQVRFESWVSRQKSGMSYARIDHAKADEQRGTSSIHLLSQLCSSVSTPVS